ncbi:MAG TPA: ABC transporter ATP-binding protein [Tepidisphaeraceae bacterium]|jgi:phospholipid/cholesterol/gamma-HCH transport system ATP-binding protein
MAIISLKNLHKRFGKLLVLDDVSIDVEEGKTLVILGPSGTGKSVLLKHIVGLLRPDRGRVYFDDKRIDRMNARELDIVRQNFGFLFQMGALFDSLNNLQNIAFPILEHSDKKREEAQKIAQEKLEMVGLPDVGLKMPAELSGGQRKRVALARAIAMNPRVVLYDEPTTGLDPIRSDVINELILKLQRELGITSIVVTHDMNSAFKVADRLILLEKGKIRFDGSPEEIRKSDDAIVKQFISGEASERDLASLMG